MVGSILAGRYAKALFELAEQKGASEKVEEDLARVLAVLKSSTSLCGVIKNPAVSKNKLVSIMQGICIKLSTDKLTGDFIGVVARNGRIRIFTKVIEEYFDLMMRKRGEERAYVTAAKNLSADQVAQIEEALGRSLGRNIKAEISVNEKILGGIVVRVGSSMLDASLAGQLEKLAILSKRAVAILD